MPLKEHSKTLARVKVLATGGTIAGVQNSQTGYVAGQLTAEALVSVLPDLGKTATIEIEQIANVGSQSITAEVWQALLKSLYKIEQQNEVDAVVITHGTDTMEETAWFLQLAFGGNMPVILTGAMLPANAYGADGPQNLFDAIRVAASAGVENKGVLVVMNGEIHSARYLQKQSCEGLNAFASRTAGPLGRVEGGHVEWWYAAPDKKFNGASDLVLKEFNTHKAPFPQIPVFYVTALCDEFVLDMMLAVKPRGIIIAGVGNGNMSDATMQQLQHAAQNGTIVVRSSRCPQGFVKRNLEVNDDACGFVVANDINPQKARVLLALALQKTNTPARIQDFFNKH